jgi:hypothetical protein
VEVVLVNLVIVVLEVLVVVEQEEVDQIQVVE